MKGRVRSWGPIGCLGVRFSPGDDREMMGGGQDMHTVLGQITWLPMRRCIMTTSIIHEWMDAFRVPGSEVGVSDDYIARPPANVLWDNL